MKSTNSALRLEPAEEQPVPLAARLTLRPPPVVPEPTGGSRRPRRSLAFRALAVRDQGLRLFRCR
jgi:hypothetical protein